jgi:hypothetical protein
VYCTLTTPVLLEEPYTMIMSMNKKTYIHYSHHKCLYGSNKCGPMQQHFQASQPKDIIIIPEEGLIPFAQLVESSKTMPMQYIITSPTNADNIQKSKGKDRKNSYKNAA